MNLHTCMLTENDCYKAGKPFSVRGLMLHSTGAPNTRLSRYVGPDDGLLGMNQYGNHWNQARPDGRQVCVHGFIGKLKDGTIATYQTLPWEMRGWHAGGAANSTHIGVEICEDDLTDAAYFRAVYQEAVELFAYLCKMFDLDPLQDIICHAEGYQQGIASNHGDVLYWFSKQGKTMDDFRRDVRDQMEHPKEDDTMKTYTHTDQMPDWAQDTFYRLIDAGIVKVDAAGEIAVQECSVQPMVYLDRLCGGQIEKLPQAIKALQASE